MFPKSLGMNQVKMVNTLCVKTNSVTNKKNLCGNDVLNEFLFNIPEVAGWRKHFFPEVKKWELNEVTKDHIKTTQLLKRYSYSLSHFSIGRSYDGSTVGDISHFYEPFVYMVCKYILYIMLNSFCGRIDVDSKLDNVVVKLGIDLYGKDIVDIIVIDNEHEFQAYNNKLESGVNVVSPYRENKRTLTNGVKTSPISMKDIVGGIFKEALTRIKKVYPDKIDEATKLLTWGKDMSAKKYFIQLFKHSLATSVKRRWNTKQLCVMNDKLHVIPFKQIGDAKLDIPSGFLSIFQKPPNTFVNAHEELINKTTSSLSDSIVIENTLDTLLHIYQQSHKLMNNTILLEYVVYVLRFHITSLDRNIEHKYNIGYMIKNYEVEYNPFFLNKSFETLEYLKENIPQLNSLVIRAYNTTMESYTDIRLGRTT